MFLFWRCKQFRNSSMQCFKWKSKNVSTTYILPMSDSNSERNFWSQLFTLYKHCFADPCWWLSKNFLRELLTLFSQELYKQPYEVVMDSVRTNTLQCSRFLCYHDKIWLQNCLWISTFHLQKLHCWYILTVLLETSR